MNTLIANNSVSNRWYPISVDQYKQSIKIPYDTDEHKRMISNFAYSMQYIEYIEKQLDELKLSAILKTMLYKSYIITGMGVIELILVYLLKSSGNWAQTVWEEHENHLSNPKTIDGITKRIETKIYVKVPLHNKRMDLDSMIKKAEKKSILSVNHNVFPALKKLRESRNKVHLQIGETSYDHDYNCIKKHELQMMRRILYSILTAPEICNDASTFNFIYQKYTQSLL